MSQGGGLVRRGEPVFSPEIWTGKDGNPSAHPDVVGRTTSELLQRFLDARDAMTADDFAGLADDNHLDESAHWPPGALLVVVGGLGIPSIVRGGDLQGAPVPHQQARVARVPGRGHLRGLGLVVRGGELVLMEAL